MEEILHQLIGSFSHYLQGFIHSIRDPNVSEVKTIIIFEEDFIIHLLNWKKNNESKYIKPLPSPVRVV